MSMRDDNIRPDNSTEKDKGTDRSVAAQISMEDDCTGCAACANVCPAGAIRMVPYGSEGFYKPRVNPEVCANCGLCSRICPQHEFKDRNGMEPACYAVMASDEVRMKSSSGGVFTVLAEEVLKRGGVVCGAAFDENWRVHHIIVEDAEGLDLLRGSKYVQSFISEELFKKVRKYLEAGRTVLFTGVPCQVAGLHAFLRKEYDNLFTVDLICTYAPSPKVFEQYLRENYVLSDIRAISFRDKTTRGWGVWHNTITTAEGVVEENKYMTPYINRMFKGGHCVNCKYRCLPRPGDMTMGDFWRIHEYTSGMDDRKGTSGLLLHNDKAWRLFKVVKGNFVRVKLLEAEALTWQFNMPPHESQRTSACLNFFRQIDRKPFNRNTTDAPRESRVGIINWWFVNNRGAILTNYALNEMVNELGYEALTINYINPADQKDYTGSCAEAFAKKHLHLTRSLQNKNDLKELCNDIGTFIAGSDQILRYGLCAWNDHLFYMGWVDAHRKLLSYSASFGINTFEANDFQKNLTRHWLARFDHLSVREYDGVDIMKNTFGLEATQVLDPVFCIDPKKYEMLAEQSTEKPTEDFLAYYIMWPTEDNKKIVKYVQRHLGIRTVVHLNPPSSVENWLWYLRNARFVVTDSFKAAAFSLIFNKEFAVIPAPREYPSRFKTLDAISGLHDRFFYRNNDIYEADNLFDPIDFTDCNRRLDTERQKSRQWLREALNSPKQYHLSPEQEMYDALINYQQEETLQLGIRCFFLERRVSAMEEALKNAGRN